MCIRDRGLSAQSKVTVDGGNVAATMGSGDLQVFATPAMVALMENAAMKAVADHLPEGSTTVGAEMNVTHIKPSGVGAEIVASAVPVSYTHLFSSVSATKINPL